MGNNWPLSFISKDDLYEHVRGTINNYYSKLEPINLERFNYNLIDPIKMLFDKEINHTDWNSLIAREIARQREKSITNAIGYFHQNIFRYINHCHVPHNGCEGGWDVIFQPPGVLKIDGHQVSRVNVEMKNKHNTMNSSSASAVYSKMESCIQQDSSCACFLVEVIASWSQNEAWLLSRHQPSSLIRRVSVDRFYAMVTQDEMAFFKLCSLLPDVIRDIVNNSHQLNSGCPDTVYQELSQNAWQISNQDKDRAMISCLFKMAFGSYNGF